MGVSGNSIAGKSFQSFAVSEELLAKVTEAVMAGEKQARSSGTIQSFEVFYRGFRQNIAIGRIYLIPASVCNDRKDFPTALLYGCLVKTFGGEEIGDMLEKKIGDSEFDEYSQADFDTIKEKLFGIGEGKFASLVLFAPTWWNKREYIGFHFTEDEGKLKNNLRHQVFAAYYDPALSSAFNALMTNVNTTKIDVTDITPKINFPFLAENLLTQFPTLQKQASNKKRLALTRKTADEVTKEVLDPQELDVFESLDQALSEAIMPGTETVEEAGEANEGGFNTPDTQNEVPRIANAEENKLDPKKFPSKPKDEKDKKACVPPAAHETPITNVGPGTAAHDAQEGMVKAVKETVEQKKGEPPIGIAIDESGVARSETEKKFASAKIAGKTFKTANIKMTFGTDKVYFDMGGNKYMLMGDAADEFLEEWLPIHQSLKIEADSKRDAIVEKLVQKYMGKMEKRPTKPTKAPVPAKIDVSPEAKKEPASVPAEAMAQHASKKEASADAFTPVSKKDKVHPGNLCDADVIAAIDEKKWGTATIPLNFGKRQGGVPTVKSAASAFGPVDKFTEGYIESMLWTEEENLNEEFGHTDWGQDKLAKETMKEVLGVCKNFQHDNAQLLEEAYQRPGYNAERAGHDFWLTRNGHGAGYWDRTELEEGGLGDKLSEAAKQYGGCDLYVGDNNLIYSSESAEVTPQHEMDFQASYIASKLGRTVDPEAYDASSTKTKKARAEREAKLSKNRQKQADVALDIDSIWNEITEDMGPAPQIELPGEGGASADGGSETKTEGGSSDGRPRKSDMGKLPESFTSDEPEKEKAMSDSEAESQEDSMPEPKEEKSEESEEKWHVSSSMEDFVKEAFEDDGGFMRRETRPDPDLSFFEEEEEEGEVDHGDPRADDDMHDASDKEADVQTEMFGDDITPEHARELLVTNFGKYDKLPFSIIHDYDCQDPECENEVCMTEVQDGDIESPEEIDDFMSMYSQWQTWDRGNKKKRRNMMGSHKKADAVQPDVAEAKSEVVSPDTVDADIKQETKSVPEAAKVADAVQPDVAEAKSEVVNPDTVDSTIHQETKSVEEAAKVADMKVMEPGEGKCPHCGSYDTDEVEAEEGTHLYCHGCEQVSKIAVKTAAAGDDMPEEVPFDFGAGDLANVVMYEEDTDGAKE